MSKKRFLFLLGLALIVLLSLALTSFSVRATPSYREAASDFYQRHPSWTGSSQYSPAYHLDCFRRQYKFNAPESSSNKQDASNYFLNLI